MLVLYNVKQNSKALLLDTVYVVLGNNPFFSNE